MADTPLWVVWCQMLADMSVVLVSDTLTPEGMALLEYTFGSPQHRVPCVSRACLHPVVESYHCVLCVLCSITLKRLVYVYTLHQR